MNLICCKPQPIRVKVSGVELTPSQRKCLRRFLRWAEIADHELNLNTLWASLCAIRSRLEISILSAEYRPEAFQLFQRYQATVHHDEDTTVERYQSFLCDSPLSSSRHLEWRHGGHLFAVSFLDVVAEGISSVYFIYDSDLEWVRRLSMGRVSAMLEMALTAYLDLSFYYLGYYIADCPKMRYKGEFGPAELLDHRDWATWRPLSS